jgi:hypothetical protein
VSLSINHIVTLSTPGQQGHHNHAKAQSKNPYILKDAKLQFHLLKAASSAASMHAQKHALTLKAMPPKLVASLDRPLRQKVHKANFAKIDGMNHHAARKHALQQKMKMHLYKSAAHSAHQMAARQVRSCCLSVLF